MMQLYNVRGAQWAHSFGMVAVSAAVLRGATVPAVRKHGHTVTANVPSPPGTMEFPAVSFIWLATTRIV